MLVLLSRNWWTLALRGLLAVLLGLVAFVWPQRILAALVLLFGAFTAVDGIVTVITAIVDRMEYRQWWLVLLRGLTGIVVGVIALVWPGITALALLYLIAAWALVAGILEIFVGVRLRREMDGEWLLILNGFVSLLFGLALVLWPGAGAVALLWLVAGFAVVSGVLLIVLSLRLRGWVGRIHRTMERLV
jgi:uncharacterized membrane protein HdeD (DUF308 family)